MASTGALAGRWLLFAVGPWAMLMGGIYLWLGTLYLLAPLVLPFTAYTFSGGQWTVFSERHLFWPINIAYSVVLASATTYLARRVRFWRSVGLFCLIALLAAMAVHGLMAALGYDYWYDSP